MNAIPLVFVIVINYNGVKYLQTCLSSLTQQTYSNYKIIVFDNASTDNSIEFIQQNFPNINIIQAEKNFGFAEGNNFAMKFALDHSASYIFLVNNDTKAKMDLVEKLVNSAESDDSIGIVGPSVFALKNKYSIQERGVTIDRFGYPLAIKSASLKCDCVFFVSGCAMLIKAELIRKIGLFDKEYFMFAEDLDLCWRAQLAGYKIIVNEEAVIFHSSGGSISGGVIKAASYKTNVRRVFLREKNTIRTLIKNYNTYNMITTVPFYVALLFFECFLWIFLLKPNTTKNIVKALFWNIHFLPQTFNQRARIQSIRKINDQSITEKMVHGYSKLRVFRAIGVPNFENQ
jgi:GT2 family glycosyltransferase